MKNTLIVGLALLGATGAFAQQSQDIPRLSNGKPDLSGVWQSLTTANWNILRHGASAGPSEYGALLSTPPCSGVSTRQSWPEREKQSARLAVTSASPPIATSGLISAQGMQIFR